MSSLVQKALSAEQRDQWTHLLTKRQVKQILELLHIILQYRCDQLEPKEIDFDEVNWALKRAAKDGKQLETRFVINFIGGLYE